MYDVIVAVDEASWISQLFGEFEAVNSVDTLNAAENPLQATAQHIRQQLPKDRDELCVICLKKYPFYLFCFCLL